MINVKPWVIKVEMMNTALFSKIHEILIYVKCAYSYFLQRLRLKRQWLYNGDKKTLLKNKIRF